MDTRTHYIALIKEIFLENAAIPVSHGNYRVQPVFDEERDQYLIMIFGTDQKRGRHNCIAHLEIRQDKIYFHWDDLEYSVAQELYDRGVPDEDMVLAYQISGFNPQFEGEGYKHERELAGVS